MNEGCLADHLCAHCGLPLGPRWFGPAADQRPRYCCYGCRFAAAVSRERGPAGQLSATLARLGVAIFLSINVMMFTMVLWTGDVYEVADAASVQLAPALEDLLRYLCLLLALPVLWLLGLPLAENAWRGLRTGAPGADLLLVAGVVAAFAYSTVSTLFGRGHVYFEVGCAVLVLVTFGRWLEASGRLRATAALDALTRLLPEHVRRMAADGATEQVPLDQIVVGDWLRVLAGERIPVDGRIVAGLAHVDQQIITGESRAIEAAVGDSLFGGALNLDGDLTVECSAGPRHGTLQRLVAAVERARLSKGRYHRLADRCARWFLPLVFAVAIVAFVWNARTAGIDAGLLAALAVVLIACPCALGLATPLAAWTALSTAARGGVLFHSAAAIERLACVRIVAFDKTGTLTTGMAQVSSLVVDELADRDEVLTRAAALAAGSRHPLAQAVEQYANDRRAMARLRSQTARSPGTETADFATGSRTLPGQGVVGVFDDLYAPACLGNVRLMDTMGLELGTTLGRAIKDLEQAGDSLTCVGWEGRVRGVFGFREELRPTAIGAIADCRRLGLSCLVVTGDHQPRGQALQRQLDVTVQAGLLPDGKVAALAAARDAFGPVAMIGDGINDAPALAAADVGIALDSAADLSRESADICLPGENLALAPWAILLARRTVRVMRQNLFWAFAYNVLGMGLAAAGLLNPIWAAAAMLFSSSLVIGNSLRLSRSVDVRACDG